MTKTTVKEPFPPAGKPDKNILWEAIYGNYYDPPKIKDGKPSKSKSG